MEDCMERCSRYWGEGEGCYGVVWRESDNMCWMRNSTTGTANMVDDTGIHAALTKSSDMTPLDSDCPAADLSTHTVGNFGYTVHCGKVISGQYDTCWQGYPVCNQSPFIGFYHATSLEECLNRCIEEHPLCRGVSYNPGLEIGYANCWPKTGFDNSLSTPDAKMGILHSATVTSLDRIDTSCPEDKGYTATGNKQFEIHCGQLNAGTNITSFHSQNLTACMDACASSDKNCIGIVFDSTLANGYENCYLQNTTSVISSKDSTTYALLSGTPLPSSSGTPLPGGSNSNSNSTSTGPQAADKEDNSSSKAWIAGPVIGGILVLVLIGFALIWWRRRKARQLAASVSEKDGYAVTPAYSPNSYASNPMYNAPPSELGGDHATEMGTVEYGRVGNTKYAHSSGDEGTGPVGRRRSGDVPRFPPQELPS